MRRLMLDHFRRKAWILALGALFQFMLGIAVVSLGTANARALVGLQMQVGLFIGVFLLSFDLQRGLARTAMALPLAAVHIARGWWWATVGIPAVALSVLLCAGAATAVCFYGNRAFPWEWLALSSVITFLWLGTGFTVVFSTGKDCWHGTAWQRARTAAMSVTWGLMIGGGVCIFSKSAHLALKMGAFCAAGAIMTLISWRNAEAFVVRRAAVHASATSTRGARKCYAAPAGWGGLRWLLAVTAVRAFLIGLAIAVALPLFMVLLKDAGVGPHLIRSTLGVAWFLMTLNSIPILMHLRFLRTLPISAGKLAAVVLASILLPWAALCLLAAAVAGPLLGPAWMQTILSGCILMLAPTALCVFFVVWRGVGIQAYAGIVVTMIGIQLAPLWMQLGRRQLDISIGYAALLSALCLALAFLLTRGAIMRSARAYRFQTLPANSMGWAVGR